MKDEKEIDCGILDSHDHDACHDRNSSEKLIAELNEYMDNEMQGSSLSFDDVITFTAKHSSEAVQTERRNIADELEALPFSSQSPMVKQIIKKLRGEK